jgi:hypothetical protein
LNAPPKKRNKKSDISKKNAKTKDFDEGKDEIMEEIMNSLKVK